MPKVSLDTVRWLHHEIFDAMTNDDLVTSFRGTYAEVFFSENLIQYGHCEHSNALWINANNQDGFAIYHDIDYDHLVVNDNAVLEWGNDIDVINPKNCVKVVQIPKLIVQPIIDFVCRNTGFHWEWYDDSTNCTVVIVRVPQKDGDDADKK